MVHKDLDHVKKFDEPMKPTERRMVYINLDYERRFDEPMKPDRANDGS